MVEIRGDNKMSKYTATIITPFHNTDLRMFRSAFESVRTGTDEYILLTDHDFFEFLPAGHTPSKEALL